MLLLDGVDHADVANQWAVPTVLARQRHLVAIITRRHHLSSHHEKDTIDGRRHDTTPLERNRKIRTTTVQHTRIVAITFFLPFEDTKSSNILQNGIPI